MLTIEGLISVLGLCLTCFGLGYAIGNKDREAFALQNYLYGFDKRGMIMSVNDIVTTIVSVLGVCSIIAGVIFVFVDIRNKKHISAKTGIWILVAIFVVVFAVVLSYRFGWKAASDHVLRNAGDTGIAAAEHGDIVTSDVGNITVKGNNNDINIESKTHSDEPLDSLPRVTVQQVTLDRALLDLTVGDTASLLATVIYSDNTTDHSVIWSSSAPSIVQVDSDGNIAAVSAGTATITVQASRNNVAKAESCIVTVVNPPSKPTGYSINLSTDHAVISESFIVSVIPNEEDITEIRIYSISPSGKKADFPLSEDGKYLIDTEAGIWTIYASVTNEAGTYTAQKPEDYVEIEIISFVDALSNMYGQ